VGSEGLNKRTDLHRVEQNVELLFRERKGDVCRYARERMLRLLEDNFQRVNIKG